MHQNCILNVFDVHFLEEMNSMVYFASLSKGPPEILEDPFLCNKGFRLCECSWSLNPHSPQQEQLCLSASALPWLPSSIPFKEHILLLDLSL